ncbi:protein PBDC1-like [Haliotis rubra]|uniref:protein PBDC1-like n=1 Tax=Haliotis rubra TaxID=36100 RepID=UPI001EE61467|nr:protein PBDC1-like [Haliotis rubra]
MSYNLSDLGIGGMQSAASALKSKAEDYVNQPDVELQWAVKAYAHAETYFNLITSVDPSILKLTREDDEIYSKFRQEFPDFKVDVLTEDELKSEKAKEKWRPFCESFKGQTEDYNYGTLVRLDSAKDYSEENSILGLRIQFLAIEIARDREGHNSQLRFTYNKKKAEKKEES